MLLVVMIGLVGLEHTGAFNLKSYVMPWLNTSDLNWSKIWLLKTTGFFTVKKTPTSNFVKQLSPWRAKHSSVGSCKTQERLINMCTDYCSICSVDFVTTVPTCRLWQVRDGQIMLSYGSQWLFEQNWNDLNSVVLPWDSNTSTASVMS